MSILNIDTEIDHLEDEEREAYLEAFESFDWNDNGKISYRCLLKAMRRVGLNAT